MDILKKQAESKDDKKVALDAGISYYIITRREREQIKSEKWKFLSILNGQSGEAEQIN